MKSSSPGSQLNEPILWLKVLLDSKLEGLSDFSGVSGSKILAKRPESN